MGTECRGQLAWAFAHPARSRRGRSGGRALDAFATVGIKLTYVFDPPTTTDPAAATSRRSDGVRLELEIDNLFDARPDATLGDGRAALGYGRDDQEPLGRVVRVTVSRRF